MNPDTWVSVAKFLGPRELCRMMQLSRDYFYLFVSDRAWKHQRDRFPKLFPVFDEHASQNAADHSFQSKRAKREWCMPDRGIWFVFTKILTVDVSKMITYYPESTLIIEYMLSLYIPTGFVSTCTFVLTRGSAIFEDRTILGLIIRYHFSGSTLAILAYYNNCCNSYLYDLSQIKFDPWYEKCIHNKNALPHWEFIIASLKRLLQGKK